MWLSYVTMTLLTVVGLLLIIVVLLQRGRGGGLAGALGGMGGQSAFGTKAGDVFTRITIVIAVIWVVLAGVSGFALRADANRLANRVSGWSDEVEDENEPPVSRGRDELPAGAAPPREPAQPAEETKSAADDGKAAAPETTQDDEPAEPPAAGSEQPNQ